jgi:hypothetical protein
MKKARIEGFSINQKTKALVLKGLEGTGVRFEDIQAISKIKDRVERMKMRDIMQKILEQALRRNVCTTSRHNKDGDIINNGEKPKDFKQKFLPLMDINGELKQDVSFITDPVRDEPMMYKQQGFSTIERVYEVKQSELNGYKLDYCVLVQKKYDKGSWADNFA